VKALPAGSRVGVDARLITAADARTLNDTLSNVSSTLVPVSKNLVDLVWGDAQPAAPSNPLMVLDIKYSGKPYDEKITALREEFPKRRVNGMVISALDEIAWLFNLRGSDIEFNPVFMAYTIVTVSDVTLYVDESKVDEKVKAHLGSQVVIKPYESIWDDLKAMKDQLEQSSQRMLTTNRTSFAIENALGKANVSEVRSPITNFKAIKNPTELEGMRQCHLRDAAALCNYFAWLEEQLKSGAHLNEVDVADKLESYRKELSDFVGLSFDTISSAGPNGAIIHYKPERPTCAIVDPNLIYLCDSGGQYLDGTTDVTRTYHFGTPTAREKRCFTRVLQGHIAIDTAVFPKGTTGYLLDPFARAALWADGLDFRHGTGHGVGAFLNVHEGPHGIGTRIGFNDAPLQAGMTVTDEPGYYEDGKFGIRIENVLLVKEAQTPNNFGNRGYLGFEHVTLVPIGHNLIDLDLLSPAEKKWLNDYHTECLAKIAPLLKEGSLGLAWLKKEARLID